MLIITNTLVSFDREKTVIVQDTTTVNTTVNTWYRATEQAISDLQKGWLVLVNNNELVLASKDEAIRIGYVDSDETIKAVDDKIGFSWRHVSKKESDKVIKDLRLAGLLPPRGWK